MADATLSRVMAEHAQEAVANAEAVHGVHLDYTPESIEKVEGILAAIYSSSPRGLISRLLGRGLSDDEAARLARMYGSYVGESLLRKWGGHWEKDHPVAGPGSYPITCRGHQSFPLGWCYKRLRNGPEDNVWHKVLVIYLHQQNGEHRLDSAGQ